MGEPAGGSLTADEYKFAITGPWALIVSKLAWQQKLMSQRFQIPIVWERFMKDSDKDYERALKTWKQAGKATGEPKPSPRMVPEEALNFLRFSTALKIIVGRSVRLDQLDCVKTLLRDYLLTYLDVSSHIRHQF